MNAVLARPADAKVSQRETGADPLRIGMKELLKASAEYDRDQALSDLYLTVLRQLTPDEARIISVLATGTSYPVLDVLARGRTLLRNASTVGDVAGVTLLSAVPVYLTRLDALGLVEFGDGRAELAAQYEVLATAEVVREAEAAARRTRRVRRTVRISSFGARFWAACDPGRGRGL